MRKVISGVLGLMLIITFAKGQKVNDDLFDLSLEELMNIEIDVASGKGTTLRESPGIISYIDAEEIKNSGARDFMDILRMVPGFEFGSDVDNSMGLGVRGNWGFEGKVLILLDDQPLNETSYGTYSFGQRIPIDNIQKIEIIRGPGSALYGGVAGLAVIKVTTKTGSDLNGGHISANYGVSNGSSARKNIQASFGKAFSNDISMSVSAYLNNGKQSAETFNAMDGSVLDYKENSDIKTSNVNVGLRYKELDIRFIYDDLNVANIDYGGYTKFNGLYFGATYPIKAGEKLTITPKVQFKKQQPWSYTDPEVYDDLDDYNAYNNRITGNIIANYDPSEKLNFVFGAEYYQDKSTYYVDSDDMVFENGEKSISFTDLAVFAQGTYNSKFANITVGIRYDDHSAVDAAFVPRIALTKVVNDWHFKLLYSQAFKTPVIENVNLNPDIKPERIEVAEFETGYRLNENMILTTNLFYTKIKDVITYSELLEDGEYYYFYENFPNSGTHGFEVDYKYKGSWGFVNGGYSYYRANKDVDVEAYQIEGNDKLLLGLPGHKFTANAHIKLIKNLYLNPSLLFFSEKYFYEYDENWENLILNKLDNIFLGHINLTYENLITEGLDLGAGVYNISNAKDTYVQSYNGGGYPIPGMGTEFNFNLKYRFGF